MWLGRKDREEGTVQGGQGVSSQEPSTPTSRRDPGGSSGKKVAWSVALGHCFETHLLGSTLGAQSEELTEDAPTSSLSSAVKEDLKECRSREAMASSLLRTHAEEACGGKDFREERCGTARPR